MAEPFIPPFQRTTLCLPAILIKFQAAVFSAPLSPCIAGKFKVVPTIGPTVMTTQRDAFQRLSAMSSMMTLLLTRLPSEVTARTIISLSSIIDITQV